MIKITDIKIYPKPDHPGIHATVTIVINQAFCIRGLRIVRGKKGVFIGMPCQWDIGGKGPIDHCYPINQDTREYITRKIMEAFSEQYPELVKGVKVYST